MLTGADGSMTPLESATTPPGKLLGVAVAMGARLVPIGAMRHVAGVWPGPAFLRLAQGHTICANTPFSGLPTVIDKRFAGGGRAHGVAALGALGSTFRMGSYVETCTSQVFCLSAHYTAPCALTDSLGYQPATQLARQSALRKPKPCHEPCTSPWGAW